MDIAGKWNVRINASVAARRSGATERRVGTGLVKSAANGLTAHGGPAGVRDEKKKPAIDSGENSVCPAVHRQVYYLRWWRPAKTCERTAKSQCVICGETCVVGDKPPT